MPHQAKLSTPTPTATTPTARPYNASAACTKLCWVPPAQLRSTLRLRLRLSARYGPTGLHLSARSSLKAVACQHASASPRFQLVVSIRNGKLGIGLPSAPALRVRKGQAPAL